MTIPPWSANAAANAVASASVASLSPKELSEAASARVFSPLKKYAPGRVPRSRSSRSGVTPSAISQKRDSRTSPAAPWRVTKKSRMGSRSHSNTAHRYAFASNRARSEARRFCSDAVSRAARAASMTSKIDPAGAGAIVSGAAGSRAFASRFFGFDGFARGGAETETTRRLGFDGFDGFDAFGSGFGSRFGRFGRFGFGSGFLSPERRVPERLERFVESLFSSSPVKTRGFFAAGAGGSGGSLSLGSGAAVGPGSTTP
jgi:hypothetical protein